MTVLIEFYINFTIVAFQIFFCWTFVKLTVFTAISNKLPVMLSFGYWLAQSRISIQWVSNEVIAKISFWNSDEHKTPNHFFRFKSFLSAQLMCYGALNELAVGL